jgi:cytochrome c oxidase subunit I
MSSSATSLEASAGPVAGAAEVEVGGIYAWLATVDHKRIGILYLLASLGFFSVGGIEALVMRLQLARPRNTLVSPEAFNQLFTMHGTTMIFLVVMPLLAGFANYFVPLMIGARDMAFPRLNAFAFWLFPIGGLLLHFSVMAGGAPDAGWFSYAPLSETPYSSTAGMDYWIVALLVLGTGSVATAVNLVATVVSLRAPGLTIRRLPLFVWMTFITAILILLALPVLNASLVMLLIDRQLEAHFFTPSGGGNAVLWQHLFWTFGHPEVYIMALPAFGMISEIIPVFSRKPIFGYEFVAASTVAIAILSLGVWAHHMFAVGLGHTADLFFAAGSMLIAVPTGVKIFNWVATMWGGSIRFSTAMYFAVAFLIEFTIGGLSGITFAAAPIDWQVTDTYYLVAHFHYVLFGGSAFALQAVTYYWFPKMTGRRLSEKLGHVQFWLMVVGFNMTFFVQHFLGIMGMPRRVYTYPDLPGWGALNLVSTIGAFVMGASVLLLLWNIVVSRRSGEVAGDNPWDAWTLEWATTSPPPPDNFRELPPIRGRRPLYDLAHPASDAKPIPNPADDAKPRPDKYSAMMWSVIVSEAGFFLVLVLVFVIFNYASGTSAAGASAKVLDVKTTGIFTVALLASSATLWLSEHSLKRGRVSACNAWLVATLGLGLVFLIGQAHEYVGLWIRGVTVNSSLFATTFFTLTGFHGLHVTAGLVAMTIILGLGMMRMNSDSHTHDGDSRVPNPPEQAPGLTARRGDAPRGKPRGIETIALYWHFVDVVWLVVFTTVYLVGS